MYTIYFLAEKGAATDPPFDFKEIFIFLDAWKEREDQKRKDLGIMQLTERANHVDAIETIQKFKVLLINEFLK